MLLLVATPAGATDDPGEVIEIWSKKQGLTRDDGLARVARANSEALEEVAGDAPPGASAYLQFLLEREQITDAVVQGVVLRLSPPPGPGQLKARLGQAAGTFTHVGVGRVGTTVTVLLARRVVEVSTRIAGGEIRLCIRPRGHVKRPGLLVTYPGGRIVERQWRGARRCFDLPPGPPGRYQVEVVVEGRYGPEVAALFPLYAGRPPPQRPSYKLYPTHKREHVEIRLMRLVNAARRAHGLTPLRPSSLLAGAARQHSQDMLLGGYFGHLSPSRGNLAQRLSAAGIQYSQASENLAMATCSEKAHDGLMASPIHRQTLLDPQATHIGVGVASDTVRGLLYVTEIFARF